MSKTKFESLQINMSRGNLVRKGHKLNLNFRRTAEGGDTAIS